jgi:hypothetical protein
VALPRSRSRSLPLPLAAPATPSPVKSQAVPAPSRSRQEAAFLRTVNRKRTASVITGDLPSYAGSHVAYTCDVDEVHRKGVIVGQCGPEAEPVGLFIEMPNVRVQTGQRVRVLGILEPPVPWTDIFGHTVCRVNQPLLAFIPTDPGVRSYRTGLF